MPVWKMHDDLKVWFTYDKKATYEKSNSYKEQKKKSHSNNHED